MSIEITKIIVEAANGPTTPEADRILYEQEVFMIDMRRATYVLAVDRVAEAIKVRGIYP